MKFHNHSYYLVDRGDFSFQDTVEPVYSDTTGDQGNMSNFSGCRNTQVICYLTEKLWNHNFLVIFFRMSENSDVRLHKFHCIYVL
jgi:hypothetical protein